MRHVGTTLLFAGLLLIGWPVMTWGYGQYWQSQLARSWGDHARGPAAEARPAQGWKAGPVPAAVRVVSATPFARLQIPRIDMDVVVVEGIDEVALRQGPGHLPSTGRPGESGNCAIAGHRDGWFARLDEVQPGDGLSIDTGDCLYEYAVDEKQVVQPDRGDLLRTTGSYPTLTLITCTGPGYPRSSQRLLVFARLQSVRPRT